MGGFLTPVFVTGSEALVPVVILQVQGRDDTLVAIEGRNDAATVTAQGRDDTLITVEGRA